MNVCLTLATEQQAWRAPAGCETITSDHRGLKPAVTPTPRPRPPRAKAHARSPSGDGPQHARPLPGHRRGDPQVLGGQRQRAVVDHFADPGQQVLAGLRQAAADHDHGRIEQVHAGGQRRRRCPGRPGGPPGSPAGRRSAPGRPRRWLAAGLLAARAAPAASRRPGRPAPPRQPVLPQRHARAVCRAAPAHVPGRRPCPARRAAADRREMMPAPMPVATLIEQQVVGRPASAVGLLAQRHDVDVVVHQHRHRRSVRCTKRGHVEAVPAGHDRRVDRPARRVLDRTGQADANRAQVRRRFGRLLSAAGPPRRRASPARCPGRSRCSVRRVLRPAPRRRGRPRRPARAWHRGPLRPPAARPD